MKIPCENKFFYPWKKKRIPVFFNNTPISNEKHDFFGFINQVKIINQAIKSRSTLIGIIGDYGSGKSSLTELCQKKLSLKYRKSNRINMWDIEKGEKEHDFNFLIRSFLYQLAQGNKRKNINFARYVNERQSKNYGKISLTMASHWALLLFFLAGLCFIVFFTLSNNDIFNLIVDYIKDLDKLLCIVNFSRIIIYPILFLGIIFVYWGIKIGAFVFSLWDSQGKLSPEYGDIFDNFLIIMRRITKYFLFGCKKIVYIEDLDRINNKELVIPFLKELYRFINLLPKKQKKRIAFVVTLKSEATLKNEIFNINKNDINKDDKSVYSKIFDYTLWIKPIHYENIADTVWELLNQNQKSIKSILGINKNDELRKTLLSDLDWIQKGENLNIRELKDRLNETFILYQTLKARDFEHSSVKLRKCCAVTYLHRAYPDEYEKMLKNEYEMATLIRDCNRLQRTDKKKIIEIVELATRKFMDYTTNFHIDFSEMIFIADIDEDFMMYFYNYPTSSYIKNLDEKEILDYFLKPTDNFRTDSQLAEKIERVIEQKNGIVIDTAIIELNERGQSLPEFAFENELLFSFIYNKNKDIIISTLEKLSADIIKKPNHLCHSLENILFFNIDEKSKKEIIEMFMSTLLSYIKCNPLKEIISARISIIKSVKQYIIDFIELFINEDMPLITEQELKLLNSNDEKIELINNQLIDINSYTYLFKEINNLELNEDQYIKAEKIILNSTDTKKLPDIHSYVLDFLLKNKKYNSHFLSIILNNLNNDEKTRLCSYINSIDVTLLSEEQLIKIDKMNLREITNVKSILFLEEKNLFQSSLLSRVTLEIIDKFDFIENNIFLNFPEYFDEFYVNFPESFLAIRFAAFKQLRESNTNLYRLFQAKFPIIRDYEIELINDTDRELYLYLNHSSVNSENYRLIVEYCNNKKFLGDKLFYFFNTLFFKDDNKISDLNIIKNILTEIDFKNIIHFEIMTSEQQQIIVEGFSNVYKLKTAKGSMEFMKIVNCLVPDLEKIVIVNIDQEGIKYSDYLDLINEIKKPTKETLEIICNKPLDQPLDIVITEKMYNAKYYIRYLISKTINDGIVPTDENIALEKYYQAFNLSEKFAIYCARRDDILKGFVDKQLLDSKLSDDKLIHFYKLRQPLFLIRFILERLQNNADETKKYLSSIENIDTKKDAEDFIYLITSNKYVELLRDKTLFYFIREKMWDTVMKRKLTTKVNRLLNVKYGFKEAGEYIFNDENMMDKE